MAFPNRCVLAALTATLALASPAAAATPPKLTVEGLQRPAGAFSRPLPSGGRAAVSLDLHLSDGAAVGLLGTPGPGEPPLTLRRRGRVLVVDSGDQKTKLPVRKLHHLEAAATSEGVTLAIDGQAIDTSARRSRDFTLHVDRGKVTIDTFIATPLGDARTLLLHRLAELHAVTPRGKQVLGVGSDGVLRFHRGWTRGLWPGALWQGAAITRSPVFEQWALDATIGNFGGERSDTHDLGFMYGRSSVTAYERMCKPARPKADERTCARLRRSGLTAADSLAALAATNPVAGMIPTRSA